MSEQEISRRLTNLERRLDSIDRVLRSIIRYLRERMPPPSAPTLVASFTSTGDLTMNAVLVATLPTTRQDGTSLAPANIASISFQKTSLVGSPPVAGPQQVLQTNTAAAGSVLTDAQLTFTDAAAAPGDAYTAFVTDTLGHIGAASSPPLVAPASASPPSAPTLTATFA